MNIDKENVTNNFQSELENKLLDKTFDMTSNYEFNISNIIAEAFLLYAFDAYKGKADGFDISPILINKNMLFKIESTDKKHLANVLLSLSTIKNELTVTNVLTTVKQL